MPLVTMKELLRSAEAGNYGIGAFSVANMEMIMGVIRAAEEMRSPVILQIAQSRLSGSPLYLIGPMMLAAAKEASVPAAVHFDHGRDLETIRQALAAGFTSVMIDASDRPIEENIALTRETVKEARAYGASVEAEVGQLSGSEDGGTDREAMYSRPSEVGRLYRETGADAVALSIGNAHGLYRKEPKLDFSVLAESRREASVPLVLHGGSGISAEDFRRCIDGGIRKINVATATFLAVEGAAREYASGSNLRDYFALSSRMEKAACENAKRHMEMFASVGKA